MKVVLSSMEFVLTNTEDYTISKVLLEGGKLTLTNNSHLTLTLTDVTLNTTASIEAFANLITKQVNAAEDAKSKLDDNSVITATLNEQSFFL